MIKKGLFAIMCCLLLIATGCSWNHSDSNENQIVYSSLKVNIPLPVPAGSMRNNLLAEIKEENINVWYYLSGSGVPIKADRISGLNSSVATAEFDGVANTADLVVKSQLRNENEAEFKDYYQGLISKNEIMGNTINKELNAETTAKTMIFEEKAKTDATVTVQSLENALATNNVWSYLGVTQENFKTSLDNLSLDNSSIKSAVETAAKEIQTTPAPVPDNGSGSGTKSDTEPKPTITDQGLTEEFTTLNFVPLASLAAINDVQQGLADVENGHFIGSRVGLRLAAEGIVTGNVRQWTVTKSDARDMFIYGASTSPVPSLEALDYHGVSYARPSHTWFDPQKVGNDSGSVNVKVTSGVADFMYSFNQAESSESPANWSNPESLGLLHIYAAATLEGSAYIKVENPTTGAVRIFDCATVSSYQ